ALSALLTFRHFRISPAPAVVGSLLFAFLPYHFFRGREHLFLASYYLVPPAVMLLLWIYQARGPFFFRDDQGTWRWAFRSKRTLAALMLGLLIASGGIYYAAFAGFFLVVASTAAAWHHRSAFPLLAGGGLLAIIGMGVGANLLPNLAYQHRHG